MIVPSAEPSPFRPLAPRARYPLPVRSSAQAERVPDPERTPVVRPPETGAPVAEPDVSRCGGRPPAVQNMVAIDFGTSTTTVAAFSDVDKRERGFAGPRREDLLEALRLLIAARPAVRPNAEAVLATDGRAQPLEDALTPASIDTLRLDALMASLERLAGNQDDPELWIALQDCYRAFFAARPFETLGIWPVALDLAGGDVELQSAVGEIVDRSTGRPSRRVLVGTEYQDLLDKLVAVPANGGRHDAELAALTVHRGLKRQIGLRTGGHAEELVSVLLERLRQDVQQQFRDHPRFATSSPEPLDLRRAVLTYPTVAHPGRRDRLLAVAHTAGIEEVIGHYDEAVAAAIAYLAKAMQSNFEIGFEHFLSRCRSQGGRRWEHTVLVVDVGGGTTDVALLTIGIVDRTDKHLTDGDDEAAWGRLYKVTPTVLGSAGTMFHGGDRLTLDLFRYQKAVDALGGEELSGLRDAQDYVDRICNELGHGSGGHLRLIEDVDERVPTRWSDEDAPTARLARQANFYRRWNAAEATKIDYATDRFSGTVDERRFLDHIVGGFGAHVANIAASVADRAFGLEPDWPAGAEDGDHARNSAPEDRPDGVAARRIDAVVLSGKSSRFAAVRDHLVERLRRYGVDHSRVDSYGDDTANKQAASLGACYAQHLDEKGFTNPRANLRRGTWQLDLEVRNLRFNLPAPFGVTPQSGSGQELDWVFGHAGRREFRPVDAEQAALGLGSMRSDWRGIQPSIDLHRATDRSVPWASWDVKARIGDEAYRQLGPRLRCQFEIDLDLSVHLYLTNGRPAFDLRGHEPAWVLDRSIAASIALPPSGERAVGLDADRELVAQISVVGGQSSSTNNSYVNEVAAPGVPLRYAVKVDESSGLLDALLVELDSRIHSVTRSGELRLLITFPGEEARPPLTIHTELAGSHDNNIADERYQPLAHLLVVEDGRLYYLPGAPPYWMASSAEQLSTPGRVWRVPASPPPDEPESVLHDPFNGTH